MPGRRFFAHRPLSVLSFMVAKEFPACILNASCFVSLFPIILLSSVVGPRQEQRRQASLFEHLPEAVPRSLAYGDVCKETCKSPTPTTCKLECHSGSPFTDLQEEIPEAVC